MSVELIGEDTVTVMEVMKATREMCGELMACRKIGIITMGHLSGEKI